MALREENHSSMITIQVPARFEAVLVLLYGGSQRAATYLMAALVQLAGEGRLFANGNSPLLDRNKCLCHERSLPTVADRIVRDLSKSRAKSCTSARIC